MPSKEDRFQGCLLGLAVGDAVGTTLEFLSPGTFEPITDMVGGGPFELEPGQWTDDTSMALCLAHSLVFKQGFDAKDQMNRYCNWWQWGYMSSTGDCFDIGATVSTALKRYLDTQNPFSGSVDPFSSGNGSLMRLAPIPMWFSDSHEDAVKFSGESSRTTHGSEECIDTCRYFGGILYQALNGGDKDELLTGSIYSPSTPAIRAIANGEYLHKDKVKGSGYVVESLEAAMWCFAKTENYRDAILLAANLGDDADTTAAICGQISGAFYGTEGIPSMWLERLCMSEEIKELGQKLFVRA